jgi:hypothetical protein
VSLTGVPLLVLVGCVTAAVAAGTVLGWRVRGRRRFVLRSAGVVLTEALVLLTAGLAVNRSEHFYPSWDSLLHPRSHADELPHTDVPGGLDALLRAQAGQGQADPVALGWRPAGWAGWHLAAPPTVLVPAGYLRHEQWRYPAVLVLTGAHDGFDVAGQLRAGRAATAEAGPAVMVFVTVTPSVAADTLARVLPGELMRDLRVTAHGWAVVAPTRQDPLARRVVRAAPDRYPALALVDTAPGHPASAGTGPHPTREVHPATPRPSAPAHGRSGGPQALVPAHDAAGPEVVVGVSVAVVRAGGGPADAVPHAGGNPVYLEATAADGLRTALRWACQQTPPPLPAPAPSIPPLPTMTATPTPGASTKLVSPAATGGRVVPGQPRR